MNLREARIGWSSYSPEFSVPGDRRRFAAYAAERGVTYEQARIDRPYDLVLITHHSDLSGWIARKRRDGDKLKLVFELIDSYLADRSRIRRFLKGIGRFALDKDSRLSLDFLKTLTSACTAADAVICATPEQQQAIQRLNENVHISFDWFGDELGEPKSDYRRHGKLRLVWEGQSTTVGNLDAIREQLDELADEIELHVVTDPEVRRYYGSLRYRTKTLLKRFRCAPLLHDWDRATFSDHVTSADVAVIPIDSEDDFAMGKPENKLVMLWKLGMPVLASATPAYRRAMDAAGLDLLCANSADWREKLRGMLAASADDLQAVGERGRQFAERNYSKQEFMSRFDAAFASIGFRV